MYQVKSSRRASRGLRQFDVAEEGLDEFDRRFAGGEALREGVFRGAGLRDGFEGGGEAREEGVGGAIEHGGRRVGGEADGFSDEREEFRAEVGRGLAGDDHRRVEDHEGRVVEVEARESAEGGVDPEGALFGGQGGPEAAGEAALQAVFLEHALRAGDSGDPRRAEGDEVPVEGGAQSFDFVGLRGGEGFAFLGENAGDEVRDGERVRQFAIVLRGGGDLVDGAVLVLPHPLGVLLEAEVGRLRNGFAGLGLAEDVEQCGADGLRGFGHLAPVGLADGREAAHLAEGERRAFAGSAGAVRRRRGERVGEGLAGVGDVLCEGLVLAAQACDFAVGGIGGRAERGGLDRGVVREEEGCGGRLGRGGRFIGGEEPEAAGGGACDEARECGGKSGYGEERGFRRHGARPGRRGGGRGKMVLDTERNRAFRV